MEFYKITKITKINFPNLLILKIYTLKLFPKHVKLLLTNDQFFKIEERYCKCGDQKRSSGNEEILFRFFFL